jgi:hypothetical protein
MQDDTKVIYVFRRTNHTARLIRQWEEKDCARSGASKILAYRIL